MKGKAQTQPNNHVEWANGFKSNMPDWKTARECAVSGDMLYMLKEARTFFFAVERGDYATYDPIRKDSLIESIQRTIEQADGLEQAIAEIARTTPPFPQPSGFPKPPGVK